AETRRNVACLACPQSLLAPSPASKDGTRQPQTPLDSARPSRFADPVSAVPLLRRAELIGLRPDATRADIERLCAEARARECLAVCVAGARVELAATLLEESSVKVAALVAFPFGNTETDVKRYEVEAAIEAGARGLDVGLNHGWIH